jgi:cytochrome P450
MSTPTLPPALPDETTDAPHATTPRETAAVAASTSRPGYEKDGFRFPPGLRLNLPFYIFRRFFKSSNPIALFEYLSHTYGPISHYKLGWNHIVFLTDPEMIREILINQPQFFIKERTQRRMKILLGEGLITSEGAFHMRQRRIAAPAFHRQRIQAYAVSMVERARRMREAWIDKSTIDIGAEMMHLSLEIVALTLFNTEVTSEVRQINTEVNAIMDVYNLLIALPQAEKYLGAPIPGLMRFRRARKRLDAVVHKMIADRRELQRTDTSDHGDLLAMLMSTRDEEALSEADKTGMTDEQLRDEILTIFLAGYETTANALTWTWLLLAQNPEPAARFYEEIDRVLNGRLATLEDLPQLRYTEQVFSESMRLYPPAWAMGRQSTAPFSLGPYHFPAETYFFFSQYIIQRSDRYYPDPLRFDPDRFTPQNKAGRPRFAYFPFGGGGRQCIGEAFAWMEGVLLLATIAQRWRMELLPGPIEVQPKITLRPKFPIRMRLHAR